MGIWGTTISKIVDSAGNFIDSILGGDGTRHLKTATIQHVEASDGNSSTSPLNAGQTFTGSSYTTLGVAAIQVTLKADQNATVLVEQSQDGINWDMSDQYKYYVSKNNFGITVQAIASYVRVKVTNTSLSNMTYMRLQTVVCPIVEAVPRSLDEDGLFQTTVNKITGRMGRVRVSPMGAIKTSKSIRLAGTAFSGTTVDTNFWAVTVTAAATATQASGAITLATGTTANDGVLVQSARIARYVNSMPNYYRGAIALPAVTTSTGTNKRRFGAFDATNGYFFEVNQAQGSSTPILSIVTRKNSSDTPVTVFNGDYGASTVLDSNVHTYEIWWTNSKVYFFIDDVLLHIITSTTATLVDTQSLKVGLQCLNAGGNTANNTLVARSSAISRLGELISQPQFRYQSGTTAGIVLKYSPGNLHSMIVGSMASGTVVTLYDGTTSGGAVIHAFTWTAGAQANNQPFALDFKGLPFSTGLFLVIGTANCNVTVIYE